MFDKIKGQQTRNLEKKNAQTSWKSRTSPLIEDGIYLVKHLIIHAFRINDNDPNLFLGDIHTLKKTENEFVCHCHDLLLQCQVERLTRNLPYVCSNPIKDPVVSFLGKTPYLRSTGWFQKQIRTCFTIELK